MTARELALELFKYADTQLDKEWFVRRIGNYIFISDEKDDDDEQSHGRD